MIYTILQLTCSAESRRVVPLDLVLGLLERSPRELALLGRQPEEPDAGDVEAELPGDGLGREFLHLVCFEFHPNVFENLVQRF